MAEIKKVYKNWTAYDVLNSDTVVDAVIPSQTWNSWKFLTTDGSDVSWATVDALPSQTSQSGKFLTTNGTTASWANVDALPTQTGQSWKFLTTNWTTASWDNVPWLQVAPNSPITWIKYIWYGTESDYANLSQYYTDLPGDTEFHTF